MTLGQRIQAHRTALDLSQEALGEKLGVSRQAVSKWEADGAVPDTDKLIALSKLFGVSLNELLQVEEPPRPGAADPAEPKKKPGKSRLLPVLALLAFVLGCGAYTISMGRSYGRLQGELTRLESRVAELERGTSGLDPAAPLVASYDYEVSRLGEYVTFTVVLVAAQQVEGMTVSVQGSGTGGEAKAVQAKRQGEGSAYSATLSVPFGASGATLTAVFEADGRTYTQALVRVSNVWYNGWDWEDLLGA